MNHKEKIRMIENLDKAVQTVNNCLDELIAAKVKVHVGIIMQGDAFDGYRPIIDTNTKKLLEDLGPVLDPTLDPDYYEAGVGFSEWE